MSFEEELLEYVKTKTFTRVQLKSTEKIMFILPAAAWKKKISPLIENLWLHMLPKKVTA